MIYWLCRVEAALNGDILRVQVLKFHSTNIFALIDKMPVRLYCFLFSSAF